MGEETTNPVTSEDACKELLKLLQSHSQNPPVLARGSRDEFYDKFQSEADEYDRDLTHKHEQDLDTTLIFAGLFSAVASAFIIDVQRQLQPDYTQLSYSLLTIMASASLGNIPIGANVTFPSWDGPDPSLIHIHSILYSSLGASLFAAFMAMLGRQWLSRYTWVDMRGSTVDRGRHRQLKMKGMVTWRFDFAIEALPLILQAALLLLSYALANYLFLINNVVASVVVGFAGFGVLAYSLITLAATISFGCPFQTPLSLAIASLVRLDNRRYLKRIRKLLSSIRFNKWRWLAATCGRLVPHRTYGNNPTDHIELPMASGHDQDLPPSLFKERTNRDDYVWDSECIAWMFKMSTDTEVVTAIMRFIPEVFWHADIQATPLERLYDTVLECLDRSAGHPLVIPRLKNKAYLGAKALLHIAIQRECLGDGSNAAMCQRWRNFMGTRHPEGDPDLESTFSIIDRVFGDLKPLHWEGLSFTASHHAWMGHILLYRAWGTFRRGELLPEEIEKFILLSFQSESPLPATVIVDCLLIVGLVAGIELDIDDLSVGDKSHIRDSQIKRIYNKLTQTFQNRGSTTGEVERALTALELVVSLPDKEIAENSYQLFRDVMVSDTCHSSKKWDASRLAMRGAYKSDEFSPRAGNPQHILTFLDYHFRMVDRDDESIQNALRGLSHIEDRGTLTSFDPTEPSFVRGICYALGDEKPIQLRKAALTLLSLIGDRWFGARQLEPEQMENLCLDWATTIDNTESTMPDRKVDLTILLNMISSLHWLPHIVQKKWELLRDLTWVRDDIPLLRTCINKQGLIKALGDLENPTPATLWVKYLWTRRAELSPGMRNELEDVTRTIAQTQGGSYFQREYLSRAASELNEAMEALGNCPRSAKPALEKKIEDLRQTSTILVGILAGVST